MQPFFTLHKQRGETPLQAISRFRTKHSEYEDIKLAYAGRLDPMAEGMLLILVGDECRKRDEYQKLPKTYRFQILFGVSSDSGDVLGIVKLDKASISQPLTSQTLQQFAGMITQLPPAYSAVRVKGRPLYWWAKEGRLAEIEIPPRTVNIEDLRFLKEFEIDRQEIKEQLEGDFSNLNGEFRIEEIKNSWERVLNQSSSFHIVELEATVSSGTYIRSLAMDIGRALGIEALAWRIERTQIGDITEITPN